MGLRNLEHGEHENSAYGGGAQSDSAHGDSARTSSVWAYALSERELQGGKLSTAGLRHSLAERQRSHEYSLR
ncbi:MAG TPA: hypothetical protein VF600_11755 [Abditibacteriaceae bacterium]|jgi:hypothetical protein